MLLLVTRASSAYDIDTVGVLVIVYVLCWALSSTVCVYLLCGVSLALVILGLDMCLKARNLWDVDPQEIGEQNDQGAP